MQKSTKWVEVLPWACFLQNSLPGVIAGFSPHQIVFGRDLILPGELPQDKTVEPPANSLKWLEDLEKNRNYVQNRMTKIHQSVRERYLKEHCVQTYDPGDRVWVKVFSEDKDKRDPLWMGPYESLRHVQGGRYTVQTLFGDEDHHVDSFKPYRPDLKGKSVPFQYSKPTSVPEEDT